MAGEATGTARRSAAGTKSVRVYVECGITLAVTEDPPQYIKYTVGAEKIAPNDTLETIQRTERQLYDQLEQIVEQRITKLQRLVSRKSVR